MQCRGGPLHALTLPAWHSGGHLEVKEKEDVFREVLPAFQGGGAASLVSTHFLCTTSQEALFILQAEIGERKCVCVWCVCGVSVCVCVCVCMCTCECVCVCVCVSVYVHV